MNSITKHPPTHSRLLNISVRFQPSRSRSRSLHRINSQRRRRHNILSSLGLDADPRGTHVGARSVAVIPVGLSAAHSEELIPIGRASRRIAREADDAAAVRSVVDTRSRSRLFVESSRRCGWVGLIRANRREIESTRKPPPSQSFELREALYRAIQPTLSPALFHIRICQTQRSVNTHPWRTAEIVSPRICIAITQRPVLAVGQSERYIRDILGERAEPCLLPTASNPGSFFFGRSDAETARSLTEQRLGVVGSRSEEWRFDDAGDVAAVRGTVAVVLVDARVASFRAGSA